MRILLIYGEVVQQSSGGNACPSTYFFVTVDNGTAQKSPTFGTCSDIPKVKQEGTKIKMIMPNMNGKGVSTYIYDAGKVAENGKLLK